MRRCIAFWLCTLAGVCSQNIADPDIAGTINEIPSAAAHNDVTAMAKLAHVLASAPKADVQANLPQLISLTESSDERIRCFAVLCLLSAEGMGDGPAMEPERIRLLAPYLNRLAPRLFDPATAGAAFLLFNLMTGLHPLPEDFLPIVTAALNDPRSTQPLSSLRESPEAPSMEIYVGANMVALLLNAGATFHLDPTTHIPEGTSSPEAQ